MRVRKNEDSDLSAVPPLIFVSRVLSFNLSSFLVIYAHTTERWYKHSNYWAVGHQKEFFSREDEMKEKNGEIV